MIELNLTASGNEQTLIKQYLENNVSETLAEKINNGVKIVKENKNLLSKKDLNGFIKFACEEARKQAEKGSNSACIEDEIVFGWAIHYFEEDTIEGTLYNEDGTEYKATPKTTYTSKVEVKKPPKEEKKQVSLFDFMNLSTNKEEKVKESEIEQCECENEDCDDDWIEEEKAEVIEQEFTEQVEEMPIQNFDKTTGEILPKNEVQQTFDKESVEILYTLLDGKLEVK